MKLSSTTSLVERVWSRSNNPRTAAQYSVHPVNVRDLLGKTGEASRMAGTVLGKEIKRMTSQRIGKYACLEVESRYLLNKIPDDLLDSSQGWLITDRYLTNTRLRLRHMQMLAGNEHVYKLTQKYRSETQNAYETTITNVYLTEAEYNHFEALETRILMKKRYPYSTPNLSLSIDVFEGRHQGLILAEMEVQKKSEIHELDLPSFVLKDVTEDPFFTGGNLVMMTDEEFKQGLSQRLRDPQNRS